jgi:hypothetical protein
LLFTRGSYVYVIKKLQTLQEGQEPGNVIKICNIISILHPGALTNALTNQIEYTSHPAGA